MARQALRADTDGSSPFSRRLFMRPSGKRGGGRGSQGPSQDAVRGSSESTPELPPSLSRRREVAEGT